MKTFIVYYDVVITKGVLEERCMTVNNCVTKHDAVYAFRNSGIENAIFRCVKSPLF